MQGPHAALHRRTTHDPQRTNRFDITITSLRDRVRGPVQRSPRGSLGIDRVRLPPPATVLTVRTINLNDRDTRTGEVTTQPHTPRTRSLDADPVELTEPAEPGEQLTVPGPGRRETRRPQHAADLIDRRRDVHFAVRVNTADHIHLRLCHRGHVISFGSGTCPPVGTDRTRLRPRQGSYQVTSPPVGTFNLVSLEAPRRDRRLTKRTRGQSRQRVTPRREARPSNPHQRYGSNGHCETTPPSTTTNGHPRSPRLVVKRRNRTRKVNTESRLEGVERAIPGYGNNNERVHGRARAGERARA